MRRLLLLGLVLTLPLLAQEDSRPCNNNKDNPDKCTCRIATTDREHCPPGGQMPSYSMPDCGSNCHPELCKCVNECDSGAKK